MHKAMYIARGVARGERGSIQRQVRELDRYCRTMDESNMLQLALSYNHLQAETKVLVSENIGVLLARKNSQDRYGK